MSAGNAENEGPSGPKSDAVMGTIAEHENAAGRHLPDGYVDAGYICDACTAEAVEEER